MRKRGRMVQKMRIVPPTITGMIKPAIAKRRMSRRARMTIAPTRMPVAVRICIIMVLVSETRRWESDSMRLTSTPTGSFSSQSTPRRKNWPKSVRLIALTAITPALPSRMVEPMVARPMPIMRPR